MTVPSWRWSESASRAVDIGRGEGWGFCLATFPWGRGKAVVGPAQARHLVLGLHRTFELGLVNVGSASRCVDQYMEPELGCFSPLQGQQQIRFSPPPFDGNCSLLRTRFVPSVRLRNFMVGSDNLPPTTVSSLHYKHIPFLVRFGESSAIGACLIF